MTALFTINTITFPTRSSSVMTKSILSRIFMTVNTMGLSSFFSGKTITPHKVLEVRNCLEMIRIYAKFISTKMIQFKSLWNRTMLKFIAESIGFYDVMPWRNMKCSVPFTICASQPKPTGFCFFNLRPKSLFRRGNRSRHNGIGILTRRGCQ